MGYYDTLTVNQQAALRQLPQFYNLTPEEINNIFAKIDDFEIVEATEHKRNIAYQGRLNVIKYIENGKLCSPLPKDDVKVDRGVNIYNPGFISFDFINLSTVYFKFSLPDKKRCYLTEEKIIKKLVSEHKFPEYLERSYDYIHFR